MTTRFLHLCPERRKGLLFSLGALGRLQLKGLKTLAAFLEIIVAVVFFAACPLTALLPSHLPRLPSGESSQCHAPLFPCQISPSGPPSLKIQHLPFHALGHLIHHTWDPKQLSPSLPLIMPLINLLLHACLWSCEHACLKCPPVTSSK